MVVYKNGGLNVLRKKSEGKGKCIQFGMLPVHFHFGDGRCGGEMDVSERSIEKIFALARGSEGVGEIETFDFARTAKFF